MKRDAHADSHQLALFDDRATPSAPAPADLITRVRRLMTPTQFENFAWWCKAGNKFWTETPLWKTHEFSREDAALAVSIIGEMT